MSKVFVSYSRHSETQAKSLAEDIRSLGHDVYFDQELSGGQVWWDQILSMVRKCDVFVFLLDPKSLNSTACKREFGFAADLGKPILPVLVSEGVSMNLLPPELSQIQFIDYRVTDRNTAFGLAKALANIPLLKPLPDPLPRPPEVPLSYLGNLSQKVDTASTLGFQDQCELIVELKRSLRDVEAADDARMMLERMRNRRDLLATIAEEIDDLLANPRESSSSPAPGALPEFSAAEEASQHSNSGSPLTATPAETPRGRIRGAAVGAVVGAMIWIVAYLNEENFLHLDEFLTGTLFIGVPGAITGWIGGADRRVILIASVGFSIGFMGGIIIYPYGSSHVVRFAAFMGGLGAFLGSIVGVILRKAIGWK